MGGYSQLQLPLRFRLWEGRRKERRQFHRGVEGFGREPRRCVGVQESRIEGLSIWRELESRNARGRKFERSHFYRDKLFNRIILRQQRSEHRTCIANRLSVRLESCLINCRVKDDHGSRCSPPRVVAVV